MNTEDWELTVSFIRLDFPPHQREIAQRLAVLFARVAGKNISHLRPEHTLPEILSWCRADAFDAVEFITELEDEIGFEIDDEFAFNSNDKTFRDLVEYACQKTVA